MNLTKSPSASDDRIQVSTERLERLCDAMTTANRSAARQNRILQRLLTTTLRNLSDESQRRGKGIERQARVVQQWIGTGDTPSKAG